MLHSAKSCQVADMTMMTDNNNYDGNNKKSSMISTETNLFAIDRNWCCGAKKELISTMLVTATSAVFILLSMRHSSIKIEMCLT